jgi:hypothetical protein
MDPTNVSVQSLLAELSAPTAPQSISSISNRAHSRFQAGHFRAAAASFAALERWPEAPVFERAVAASNRAQCFLCAGDFADALNACGCALGMLDGSLCALDLSNATTIAPVVDRVEEASKSSEEGRNVLQLVVKTLGRVGIAQAHLRQFERAAVVYGAAKRLAAVLGDEVSAEAFGKDADRVQALRKEWQDERETSFESSADTMSEVGRA